ASWSTPRPRSIPRTARSTSPGTSTSGRSRVRARPMTRSLRSASRRRRTGLACSALAAAGALCVAGCGGGRVSTAAAQTLHDAITAPDATELKPGQEVNVAGKTLHTVGWQVACVAGDRRVSAEAVAGQVTGSGRIVSYAGGTPAIWVRHNGDGSITVSCT